MDTITETPTTDTVDFDETALVQDTPNDSFGKEITKTLLVSVATTAIMTGGVFAASYAVEKVKEFRINRNIKKLQASMEDLKKDVTETDPKQD